MFSLVQWKTYFLDHLKKLYLEDTEAGYGVRRIRKLKYEHIHLSLDLAAQVIVRLQCTDLLTIILQVLSE